MVCPGDVLILVVVLRVQRFRGVQDIAQVAAILVVELIDRVHIIKAHIDRGQCMVADLQGRRCFHSAVGLNQAKIDACHRDSQDQDDHDRRNGPVLPAFLCRRLSRQLLGRDPLLF